MIMIARGGAKALSIHAEVIAYTTHLEISADAFAAAAASIKLNSRRVDDVLANDIGAGGGKFIGKADCSAEAVAALQLAGKCNKLLSLVDGCEPVMRHLAAWLRTVVQVWIWSGADMSRCLPC